MNELGMLTFTKIVLGINQDAKCYRNSLKLMFPTGPLTVTDQSSLFFVLLTVYQN